MALSHELRLRAEQALSQASRSGQLLPAEVRELIRDLQHHHVELELQNQGLRDSQIELNRLVRELREAPQREAVGTLASAVAHEFNNRLMAIVGCVELAEKLVNTASEVSVLLGQLKAAALRGRAITTQLLTFARKTDSVEFAELDTAVTASAPLLRQILGEKVQLQMRLQAPDARVGLSDGLIEQVLLTLAANTRDAVAERGTLRIETRCLADGAEAPHVFLVCSDDGSGMDADTQAQAFEPFFTTKAVGAGIGLGLALVHGIIERAGGRIELSSELGRGTTLSFRLPVVAQDATVAAAHAALRSERAEAALAGAQILVVEDESLIRSTIVYHLRELGCQVFEAESYEAALVQLRARSASIQLVLSDVVLGRGARGNRIAERAREFVPDLRVLFMSAHPAHVLMRRGWLERGARVLEKPFTADQLKQAVLRSLG